MDPITQGTVGAAFAQSTANKNNILRVGVIGFLAGLAPDLDVLIRSSTDPILFLEYHRQFTHSLFFIPIGSLIVALVIFPLVKSSMSIKTVYFASLLGYATHGLLDACTSYGTQLFCSFQQSTYLQTIRCMDDGVECCLSHYILFLVKYSPVGYLCNR